MSLNILLAVKHARPIIQKRNAKRFSGHSVAQSETFEINGPDGGRRYQLADRGVVSTAATTIFGMVFIALGVPLLAAGSKRTRRVIQHLRWRYYRHNEKVEYLLARMPALFAVTAVKPARMD